MNGLPVRLKIASVGGFSGGGFTGQFTNATVRVKNIAFIKEVTLHYKNNGAWMDESLAWKAQFGNYDLFSVTKSELIEEFVIRYSTAGQTFWDNNGGWNYRFAGRAALIGGNVALSKATAKRGTQAGGGFVFDTSWIEGEIFVSNLSFGKSVGIRLTVDGGATWSDVPAGFGSSGTGSSGIGDPSAAEIWKFKSPELNFNPVASEFRFAVFYRNLATGEAFWDNNFAQDYKVSKANGSTIE
ncbi:MAG TPA: hypothetical protein VKA97_11920 [Pyrinomonadaceae bacterium]|nr:hypothetical protein [Pyrinomonadaceae bacterium]